MVRFNEKSFTIEVEVDSNPIEGWLNTHDELIDMLQSTDPKMTADKNYYYALELLRQMMPDYKTAKKMTE